jgi:hypothetical protein
MIALQLRPSRPEAFPFRAAQLVAIPLPHGQAEQRVPHGQFP